ncbi:2'-5' RNA ligase family protein [Nocardioides sp. WL0053]|jgi:2'-5' RNA ligase|uniref:2'-5' RNA ligase family protein n=1 Tax=Nocardioides jiangsuensis TaxID=2866161 RepID=A0ABS7RM10_9ACTN|nr:2'-5' RNA ligase family protein [Nocardioides jiangsuensis]MBY9076094.1 2'-5' RNA ligase family protein [Nocardioides jiangsuensis]
MALAVCLMFDARGDHAVRQLWQHLEDVGVPTLLSHTHGRHVPHLSYAVLRTYDLEKVVDTLGLLPDEGPMTLHFDALGMFRRSRTWLVPAVTSDIAARQERVVQAVESTGADLHRHYRPGVWVPHCTLTPRTRLDQLTTVASAVYDVLPIVATVDHAVLIDTSTGAQYPLENLP